MAEEWWEGGSKNARRQPKRRGNRNSVCIENSETSDEVKKDASGGSEAGDFPIHAETVSAIEGDNGRGSGKDGREPEKEKLRSGCACPGCTWTQLEVTAYQRVDEIGKKLSTDLSGDRAKAFENAVKSIAENLALIVFSRAYAALDSLLKMFMQAHTMIGAPKKMGEESQEKPLEKLREWLSGGDVEGFSVDIKSDDTILEDDDTNEEEDEDGDES